MRFLRNRRLWSSIRKLRAPVGTCTVETVGTRLLWITLRLCGTFRPLDQVRVGGVNCCKVSSPYSSASAKHNPSRPGINNVRPPRHFWSAITTCTWQTSAGRRIRPTVLRTVCTNDTHTHTLRFSAWHPAPTSCIPGEWTRGLSAQHSAALLKAASHWSVAVDSSVVGATPDFNHLLLKL